jgi:hypothetical protein
MTVLPLKTLLEMVSHMGEAPDGQLDKTLAAQCQSFQGVTLEEVLRFTRDLRDKAVYIGGASPFVMHLFATLLEDQPEEDESAKVERRAELERTWLQRGPTVHPRELAELKRAWLHREPAVHPRELTELAEAGSREPVDPEVATSPKPLKDS